MDIEYLEKLTSFSERYRNTLVEYFVNLPEEIQVYILGKKYISLSQLQKKFDPEKKDEFFYGAFLITIERYRKIESKVKRKVSLTQFELDFLGKLLIKKILRGEHNRRREKKDSVLKYRKHILELRDQGLTWGGIATYLKLQFKVDVHKSYISHLINKDF